MFAVFGCITAFCQTPVIHVSPAGLSGFLATWNNSTYVATSQTKSYTVSGTNLIGDINIYGGASGYGVVCQTSLTETPFVAADIHLTPVAGIVAPTTIYVRMRTGYIGNIYEGIPNFSNGAVTKEVGISGDVIATEPTVSGSISFGARTYTSIAVNVNGGNGEQRVLLVKESSPVDVQPVDLQGYYPGNGTYGTTFTHAGNGNYAVYAGLNRAVTVTNLTPGKTYYFAVYEYNATFGTLYPPMAGNEGEAGYNYLLQAVTGNESTMSLTPLPIVVNYLNGYKQANKHLLNWKVTCISTPRVTMELERSADSRNFVTINSITADAVRCGSPFDHTDASPLKGMNYYRLKMTDIDGRISYSSVVALLNAVKGFDIVNIAPNPVVSDNLNLNVASAQAGKMEIMILDMQGRLVSRQSLVLISGFNSLPVTVANLAAGTYSIYGIAGEHRSRTLRFVKQ